MFLKDILKLSYASILEHSIHCDIGCVTQPKFVKGKLNIREGNLLANCEFLYFLSYLIYKKPINNKINERASLID